MKFLSLVSLASALSLAACATVNPSLGKAEAWWASPATQSALSAGASAARNAVVSVGEQYAVAQISGQKFSLSSAALATVPSIARSLELSGDVSASAVALAAGNYLSNPADKAGAVALLNSAVGAVAKNVPAASGALEGAARAVDALVIAP